jgi:integrase
MARTTINRLSDRRVRTAKPGMHPDGGGLYLRVTAGTNGVVNRYWLFRYADRKTGKDRQLGIGPLDTISLAQARTTARECREQLLAGLDPVEQRRSQRAFNALGEAKAITFDQCCDGYVAAHEAGWGGDHRQVWVNSIRDYVTPVFGRSPVAAIDTGLVLKVLEPIWTSKHETARRLRARIESVLDWARARGYRTGENPAQWKGHLSELLPKSTDVHIVRHHPALPYAEVSKLAAELRACDDRDARCLELLILTASRVGAVTGARGEEFDLASRIWTIPAARMKRRGKRKAMPFRVPLSEAAIAVVERTGKREGLLFPRACDKSLEKAHGRADITSHGFRSTFRDWAAECTAFPREVIEMAMAHAVGDETEEAYFRSDLFDKRRKLMEAWASYCDSAPAGSNVVQADFGRKAANEAPA